MNKQKTRCDACGVSKGVLVYFSLKRKLCMTCFSKEREHHKLLINSLPSFKPVDAPLGYHFFESEYFLDSSQGKKFAETIFSMPMTGMRN